MGNQRVAVELLIAPDEIGGTGDFSHAWFVIVSGSPRVVRLLICLGSIARIDLIPESERISA